MAAGSESHGLKIAVAVFVSLTVILAVSSYFLYSRWSDAEAQLVSAKNKQQAADRSASTAVSERDEMLRMIGTRAQDFEAAKTEMKNRQKEVDDKIAGLSKKVNESVAKAQAAGVAGPELQEHRDTIQRLIQEYQSEVNKNYISSLSRLVDIYDNLNLLNTSLAMNYTQAKRSLESANTINKTQMDALAKANTDLKEDLSNENKKHDESRNDLIAKVDTLSTERDKLLAETANLNQKITQLTETFDKDKKLTMQLLREYREQLEKNENVLDVPDGRVLFVDYRRNELHTNLTRSMGTRPQMVMSIFDSASPGIPTDKPKGKIEIIQVGEQYSIARIVKTVVASEPIRVGDIVHSAAWSPNEPLRFALIGKIDVNRDGRDDREDLKRMIRAAGGIVDFDLPPPGTGKKSGQLTARDAWYVIDELPPIREAYKKSDDNLTPDAKQFEEEKKEVLREARASGVRPMPLKRLLAFLGYEFGAPPIGRVEARDANTLKAITRPRQATDTGAQPPATDSGADKTDDAAKSKDEKAEKDDEMKDEKKGDKDKGDDAEKDAPK
jgi:hypothetical protein